MKPRSLATQRTQKFQKWPTSDLQNVVSCEHQNFARKIFTAQTFSNFSRETSCTAQTFPIFSREIPFRAKTSLQLKFSFGKNFRANLIRMYADHFPAILFGSKDKLVANDLGFLNVKSKYTKSGYLYGKIIYKFIVFSLENRLQFGSRGVYSFKTDIFLVW
jgi:hypothetical protein